jgi:hypothetical protein
MPKNFPTRAPVGLIFGSLLAVFSVMPVIAVCYHTRPAIERFYFGEYVSANLSQTPVGTVASFFHKSPKRGYFLLEQNGKPVVTGDSIAASHLFVRVVSVAPAFFSGWLQQYVYGGRDLQEILHQPVAIWIGIALSVLILELSIDFSPP